MDFGSVAISAAISLFLFPLFLFPPPVVPHATRLNTSSMSVITAKIFVVFINLTPFLFLKFLLVLFVYCLPVSRRDTRIPFPCRNRNGS